MDFKDISPELQAKAKECTTGEELVALAKEQGYELTDADLDCIAGGGWGCSDHVCTALGQTIR